MASGYDRRSRAGDPTTSKHALSFVPCRILPLALGFTEAPFSGGVNSAGDFLDKLYFACDLPLYPSVHLLDDFVPHGKRLLGRAKDLCLLAAGEASSLSSIAEGAALYLHATVLI